MWLITTLIFAIIASVLVFALKGKYKLGSLALMLWGAVVMILVDFIVGYEGGSFIEFETDGLVPNATVLGLLMLIPVFVVWVGMVFVPKVLKYKVS